MLTLKRVMNKFSRMKFMNKLRPLTLQSLSLFKCPYKNNALPSQVMKTLWQLACCKKK